MSTHDRAGNAYGSNGKSATNFSRLGNRDVAGGGSVYGYSAATRKATPLTSEEYHGAINRGETPQSSRGSQAQYKVANNATAAKGETFGNVRSDYRAARTAGLSPDDSRAQAIAKSGGKMTHDYKGDQVR